MFEHAVVAVRDDESGRDAIALSRKLTSAHARLTLLHVEVLTTKPAPDSGSATDALKRRHALQRLRGLAAEAGVDAGVSCVQARSVRRGLHEFAAIRRADLLVVGASRLDDGARDLIGDDTEAVLEDPPCEVAVAPAGFATCAAEMRRVGVAYDGRAESDRALALGRRLAVELDAELVAFQVLEPASYADDPWAPLTIENDSARQPVLALGGVEPRTGFGDAVTELAGFAESVDLLVLGSHRHRRLDHLLGPSTAQRLADAASSPLLVLASH